jgi:hypothetical protein
LHFLNGTHHAPDSKDGVLGRYVVHYADGQQRELPIVYGKDLEAWQMDPTGWPATNIGKAIPMGTTAAGQLIHLFHRPWENPLPEVEVVSIDLVAGSGWCAPFLVALTAE